MKPGASTQLNSLLMSSAVRRIAAAMALIAGLWLAVAWALLTGS